MSAASPYHNTGPYRKGPRDNEEPVASVKLTGMLLLELFDKYDVPMEAVMDWCEPFTSEELGDPQEVRQQLDAFFQRTWQQADEERSSQPKSRVGPRER